MGKIWWLLLLVTAEVDGTFSVTEEQRYDYKPSCQMAAEARQMYLTGSWTDQNKGYICVGIQEQETDG